MTCLACKAGSPEELKAATMRQGCGKKISLSQSGILEPGACFFISSHNTSPTTDVFSGLAVVGKT
jgi:hypothetical protein